MKIGDKVWLRPLWGSCVQKDEAQEYEIRKIGRKYFEVGKIGEASGKLYKFDIKTLKQASKHPDWLLYLSKQDILDEQEKKTLEMDIREALGYGNTRFSLDQLRRIKAIMDED